MFKLMLNPFYAPPDAPAADKTMGVQDMIDFMKDDDKPEVIELDPKKIKVKSTEPEIKDVDETTDDDDDDDENGENEDDEVDIVDKLEDELNEDEIEPTEAQLELVTPVKRREILKKYPSLFKDFPYLEKSYYREQQFTEVFPTIPDAKEAAEKAKILDSFDGDLREGNTLNVLKAVKEANTKSFAKMVDDYLPNLAKVDEKAFNHVVGDVVKQVIMSMVTSGRDTNNTNLQEAAAIINQFVFGSTKFEPTRALAEQVKDDPKEDKVSTREQQFIQQKFDDSQKELGDRIDNSLKATIEAHIDKNSSLSDYVKRNAVRDALDKVKELITKDTRFKTIVDRLWDKAVKENFSRASVDAIRSAYMQRAKPLLAPVITGARNEALKGMGKRTIKAKVDDGDDEDIVESQGSKKPQARKNDVPTSKKSDGKKIPANMTSLEYLMRD